ncbi:hypothetical protein [Demequina maris]|uniref:hypothetical protein n=1 Tax=Demequina maris TaxID=1638982 RepID=UPI0007856575|nr:hypothetical protein [Demequina maris]
MYLFDEVGYLAGGSVIAGADADWALCGSSYSVGYSVLLAPLWWLPVEPTTIYQIAVFLSAALGAAVMWPATVLGRMLGAPKWLALGVAGLVTLVPARALMDNYVLAENLLTFLVVWAAVFAMRIGRGGATADHVWFGVVLGLAAAVHSRALPLVAVGIVWLLARRWRGASSAVTSIVATVIAGGAAAIGYVGQNAMGGALFADDTRLDDLLGSVQLAAVATVTLGQVFTQVVSWSLLTMLGGVVVAAHVRAALAKRGADGLSSAWVWLLTGVAAQAAFFVLILSASAEYGTRLDVPTFGRYLDPFVVSLAVVGAATMWTRKRPRATRFAFLLSLASVALYAVLIVPSIDPDARWIPFAIPGLEPFLDPATGDDRPSLMLAALAAAIGCVVLYGLRSRPRLGLPVALIGAVAVTLATDALRVDPFEADVRTRSTILVYLRETGDAPVALVSELLPCAENNKLQFELAGRATVVSAEAELGDGYVIGPAEWPDAADRGLERIPLTAWQGAAIWAHAYQP